jgi:hypothetical protein
MGTSPIRRSKIAQLVSNPGEKITRFCRSILQRTRLGRLFSPTSERTSNPGLLGFIEHMATETISPITLSDGSIRLRKVSVVEETREARLKREATELEKALAYFQSSTSALEEYARKLESAAAEEERVLNFSRSTADQIERTCALHQHSKLAFAAQDAACEKAGAALDDALERFHHDLAQFHIAELESARERFRRDIRSAARWPAQVPPFALSILEGMLKWGPLTEFDDLAPPPLSAIRGSAGYFKRGSRGAVPLALRLLEQYRQLLEVKL